MIEGNVQKIGLSAEQITTSRSILVNTLVNFIGFAAPLLMAVIAVPILIRDLGNTKFGVLTLAYALLGYASFLDLGIGRSLTKLLAERWGSSEASESESLIWTSLILMFGLGVAGTIGLILLTPWLVRFVLKITTEERVEIIQAFYWMAVALPFVITNAGFRAIFESRQQFRIASLFRIVVGILTFGAPLAALPFSRDLGVVMISLVASRILVCALQGWVCLRDFPSLLRHFRVEKKYAIPLLSFGGWVTVNTLAGSLALTLDRFFIAGLISTAVVGYYATPYEVITKLWLLTGALGGVLFPTFSALSSQNFHRVKALYRSSCLYTVLVTAPITALIVILVRPALTFWLGPNFAEQSFRVGQLLAVGTFMLGIGTIPWTLLQGFGRFDIPAKLNLIELPIFMLMLWFITPRFGIEGTALVWSARAFFDIAAMFVFAERLIQARSADPEVKEA